MNQTISTKEKLLIMGIDSATMDVLSYAASNSIYTIITDYNSIEAQPIKKLSDESWTINITDLDQLEQRCRQEGVTAVFAGCHELCLDMTRELCRRLDLPFYASDKGWEAARNKTVFKFYCAECGLDTPRRYPLTSAMEESILKAIQYPVITKPSDASSQRGFSICRNEAELRSGYEKALSYSANGDIIVEDFIEGEEADIICYVSNGHLQIMCMNDRLGAMINGRMNQTFTPNQSIYYGDFKAKHLEHLQKMAELLEYQEGAIFFQAIRRGETYYFLEMGLRLDGIGCWTAMEPCFGFNYLNCMVDLARGRKSSIDCSAIDFSPQGKHSAIYLYWATPGQVAQVHGLDLMEKTEGIRFVLNRFKAGDQVSCTDNMLQIAYFIGIVGKSSQDLADKLKFINENLYLTNEKGENLMVCYDQYDYIIENY